MKKKPPTLEQFIEGANRDEITKQASSPEDILLSATGNLQSRSGLKANLFYYRPDIEHDISKHCIGNNQAILTYLVRSALDKLIEDNEVVFFDMAHPANIIKRKK